MVKTNQRQIGMEAEQKACAFLLRKGYRLIAQNYSCYSGEIDLIMQDQEDIVFIEVRIRHCMKYGSALESVTRAKMNKLIKAATVFLQAKKWLHQKNSRFDIIAIQSSTNQIEWYKNAFTVDKYW